MNDRMFHVLVLGGMALVGCGGAVGTRARGDASPDEAGPTGDGSVSDASSWLDAGVTSADAVSAVTGDGSVDLEGAASSSSPDIGTGDSSAYSDATIINPVCGLPCEAPPQ